MLSARRVRCEDIGGELIDHVVHGKVMCHPEKGLWPKMRVNGAWYDAHGLNGMGLGPKGLGLAHGLKPGLDCGGGGGGGGSGGGGPCALGFGVLNLEVPKIPKVRRCVLVHAACQCAASS